MAGGVTGEIHYVDAGYNKVGMPDPKNITWYFIKNLTQCLRNFYQRKHWII